MITAIATKENGLTDLTNIASTRAIINLIYPVGSVYTSLDADFDPNTAWSGTTWELQKEGIFIEATNDDTKVGTETEAGLPNVHGWVNDVTSVGAGNGFNFTSYGHKVSVNQTVVGNATFGTLIFDAQNVSSVYGKSTTVQPHSVKAKIWKRVG